MPVDFKLVNGNVFDSEKGSFRKADVLVGDGVIIGIEENSSAEAKTEVFSTVITVPEAISTSIVPAARSTLRTVPWMPPPTRTLEPFSSEFWNSRIFFCCFC